ncbi:MAG: VCBS repeat-containing protein [Chryseolinea sp.]
MKYVLAGLIAFVGSRAFAQIPGNDVKFKRVHIWDSFYTEASTIADVNKDGKLDIVAGARWFEAPDWKAHDIWQHKKFDYTKGYSDSFLNFTADVNEDGWVDLVNFDFPGKEVYWLENPGKSDVLWKRYLIDSLAFNESPMMVDIDSDGKKDLVFGNEKTGQMNWWSYSVKAKKVTWRANAISEPKSKGVGMFAHGLGWGDINGDGVKDVMIIGGWWEGPKDMRMAPWKFHETSLGYPCSQMLPYDFDGDGDTDVISGSGHNFGLWWHEQVKDKDQNISFIKHVIDSSYSELHSIVLKDVNNDGLPDLITGKRFFSHQGHGPGGMDPAVVYWYELLKDGNQRPVWVRHLIDNNSGVGIQFEAEDMNKDGLLDFAIGNKNGIFYFEQIAPLKTGEKPTSSTH